MFRNSSAKSSISDASTFTSCVKWLWRRPPGSRTIRPQSRSAPRRCPKTHGRLLEPVCRSTGTPSRSPYRPEQADEGRDAGGRRREPHPPFEAAQLDGRRPQQRAVDRSRLLRLMWARRPAGLGAGHGAHLRRDPAPRPGTSRPAGCRSACGTRPALPRTCCSWKHVAKLAECRRAFRIRGACRGDGPGTTENTSSIARTIFATGPDRAISDRTSCSAAPSAAGTPCPSRARAQ
jgi:hypothetical protein